MPSTENMSALYVSSPTTLAQLLLILYLLNLSAFYSLSLQTPAKASTAANPNFDPQIILLGNARFTGNGSLVLFASSSSSDASLLLYERPFNFRGFAPRKTTSFATEFAFSFTGKENSLFLLMGPRNFTSKFLGQGPFAVLAEKDHVGVAFFTSKDSNVGGFDMNLVPVDVGYVSSSDSEKELKLKSWIDYDAGSKRLEVRSSKLGEKRPLNPIIVYPSDLSEMWPGNEVYVGLGAYSGNLSETYIVSSWRFRFGKVPSWMHSLPVDPDGYTDKDNEVLRGHKRSLCPVAFLAGMIIAGVCGAFLAFVVLNVWSRFVNRKTPLPIDGIAQPAKFRYKPMNGDEDEDATQDVKFVKC